MSSQRPDGDLSQFRWASVVLPLVFTVLLVVFKGIVLDSALTQDESRVAELMIVSAGILIAFFPWTL